jgi:hypothetical protein
MPLSPKSGGRNGTAKSKVASSSGNSKSAKKALIATPQPKRGRDPQVYLQNVIRATELFHSSDNNLTQREIAGQCEIGVDTLRK